jgi:uncharacterized protein YyaL (SSP411 family)
LRFGVTPEGNFEGATILTAAVSAGEIAQMLGMSESDVLERLRTIRDRLYTARSERIPPGKDTKILAAWNGLAIRALAEAGGVLGRSDWLEAAERAAGFVLDRMRPEGRLVRSYRDGPGAVPAFLEDYSFLIEALISLYEATFNTDTLHEAERLVTEMVETFQDLESGAFFDAPAGEDLVVRPRSFFDNPIPSGNSAATFALLRLHALTGRSEYLDRARGAFQAVGALLPRAPLGFAYLLSALDFYLAPPVQIAIAGTIGSEDLALLLREVRDRYLPNAVVAAGASGSIGLLEGRTEIDGRARAYVCRHFSCNLPVATGSDLGAQLDTQGE